MNDDENFKRLMEIKWFKYLVHFSIIFIVICSIFFPNVIVYGAEGDYIGVWNMNALNAHPYCITTDGINIWITDWSDKAVYKYTMNGVYINFWLTNALNDYPFGITTDGVNIWVTDFTDKAVYKYTMAGVYINFWSTNALNSVPRDMTTDGINIWVVDYNDKAVYKYDMNGVYINFWSTTALNAYPYGITTDERSIWVVDFISDTVYKYNMAGVYISSWSTNILNEACIGITTDKTTMFITDITDKAVYKYEAPPLYLTPDAPTKLFGVGFNNSIPYVDLYWSHNNLTLVDFFEVHNSTDKISWDILGYNTTTQYIDYQVVNGTCRYYKVRACKEQPDGWHNSTFSYIDFEKVYFIKGNGAPSIPIDNNEWFIAIIFICVPLLIILGIVLMKRR